MYIGAIIEYPEKEKDCFLPVRLRRVSIKRTGEVMEQLYKIAFSDTKIEEDIFNLKNRFPTREAAEHFLSEHGLACLKRRWMALEDRMVERLRVCVIHT